MQGREDERERRQSQYDNRGLKQPRVRLPVDEPRVQKEQREREDRNARRRERV